MKSNPAWRDARSMLAVRLDGIGDLLMTTPALRALKDARAGRSLTLLVSPAGATVARALPFIDDVIVFRAPWMKSAETGAVSPDATIALGTALRARGFDAAVIFTVCTQSALPAATLLFEAAIPVRAAYARENPYALLTDWRAEPDRELAYGMRHEVERQIDLVTSLGISVHDRALQFPDSAAARRAMLRHARACGLDTRRRWLVVHPGATASSRRYPVHRFSEAVRLLAAKDRWQIAIAGDEADKATARALATNAEGVVDLAGRLDLAELAALLEAADAVVCNNSSPAHLAAAVGTPVVDLYALTNPQHTPWGVAHRVLSRDVECRWCLKSVCPHGHQRCLADVAPSAIVAAVEALLPPVAQRHRRLPGSFVEARLAP
jgi:lipopolysaccharide heptosyltransferase II